MEVVTEPNTMSIVYGCILMILSSPSILKILNRRKGRGEPLYIHNNTWNFLVNYSYSSNRFEMFLFN